MFSYKGYFITASSNKLEESKKWMTGLCSAESYDSKIPGKNFRLLTNGTLNRKPLIMASF